MKDMYTLLNLFLKDLTLSVNVKQYFSIEIDIWINSSKISLLSQCDNKIYDELYRRLGHAPSYAQVEEVRDLSLMHRVEFLLGNDSKFKVSQYFFNPAIIKTINLYIGNDLFLSWRAGGLNESNN